MEDESFHPFWLAEPPAAYAAADKATRPFRLGDVEAYRVSFYLSNYLWQIVVGWDTFAHGTVGSQLVRAADSVSANIAEGYGRHGKRDKIRFCRIARGSLLEVLDWNEKAKIRHLLTPEQYTHVFAQLQTLPKSINKLIKSTELNLKE